MAPHGVGLLLFCALWISQPVYCLTVTKTVSLDTSNESQDGATITTLRDDVYVNGVNAPSNGDCGFGVSTCWALYAEDSDDDGYHLQLSLDDSWAFDGAATTNLTIEVVYNTETSWSGTNNLVVAFSQSGSNAFFATKMYIDESYEHMMYPEWDSTSPYTADLADGDPATRAYLTGTGWYGVFLKMMDNPSNYASETDDFSPYQSSRHVETPLTFSLSNVPGSHVLFSYTNPGEDVRSCGFSEMSSITAMNVYFAMNYNGHSDSLNIESISVALSYDPITIQWSNPPTQSPSTNPSSSPTSNPTQSPSVVPTQSPSVIPTNPPSVDPTLSPSANPTFQATKSPSTSPTQNPSTRPTYDPTMEPSDPSGSRLTMDATSTTARNELQMEATLSTPGSVHDHAHDEDNSSFVLTVEMNTTTITIAACLLVICCCVCALGMVHSRKQRDKSKRYRSDTNHMVDTIDADHVSIASVSVCQHFKCVS